MKIGIIGLGNHAVNRVMPALAETGIELGGITTRDTVKGESIAERFSTRYYRSIDEMLHEDIDSVYIASPNFLHYEHALKALNHGKNVLVEKQMTLRSSEARELIETSRDMRLKLAIGFHLRFHPALVSLEKIMGNDRGEIRFIGGTWAHRSARQDSSADPSWWNEPDKSGGGSVMGTGVHVIDTLLNLYGKFPRKVTGFRFPETNLIDTTMMINMQFDRAMGYAISSREMENAPNDLTVITGSHRYEVRNFFSTEVNSTTYVDGEEREKFLEGNMYREELLEFNKAVIGLDNRIATGRDGYNVVRVTEDAQKFFSMTR
ncbi:MAG: Gfo/Idh/MocA family oxidoreductase [Candidatus Thermoplasmatota archaeon]|jgi:predicted dehydrogenase|nr:Gfo/Idh/MocA family oxidoreductase [Candidatus Thermoplasmatota archaeon]MCL5790886.1 Gfo/Idh/MocA family oxidoreductase [Candidatus Thermoplasmatota archaeon]